MSSVESASPAMEAPVFSKRSWQGIASLRRWLLLFLVIVQTSIATWFMKSVLPYYGGNAVEIGMLCLFAILFSWISVGFWIGVFGFFYRCRGGDPASLMRQIDAATLQQTPLTKTAILLPIYHESVERSLGGLKAVYQSVERTGQLEHFDFFILSDSRNPDIWLEEQVAWKNLCKELNAEQRIFYRRRTLNLNYKSGNVGDFLRRWGANYEYMIVLDADSLMGGDTLVNMVQLMQRNEQVGILQTSPSLLNGRSLFARVQQFGSQLYGPLFTTGLASIQLGEAAFWGHNAILRIKPFMTWCGLRKLPGRGLFSGPVMSHDFVEAAYMGRAGYEVWLEPGLGESYEESPPSLVDELMRDRRWTKGNMQHLWLMFRGSRIRLAHRAAFLNGIMSYLASPLWLGFLILSTIATTSLVLWPINYFPDPHQLFPLWPEWDPQKALILILTTFGLLFAPKFLAIADAMIQGRSKQFGGKLKMLGSVLFEIVVSALLAPIRMLSHSRYVLEALFNFTLRWAGQNRTDETGWWSAFTSHAPGMVLALSWSLFALWLQPMFFYWSLPVALPLIFAAPISVLLSKVQTGQKLRRKGWLLTPEERSGSVLVDDLEEFQEHYHIDSDWPPFIASILNPKINRFQIAMARDTKGEARLANLKALREKCLEEGADALTTVEKNRLAKDANSLRWLHEQAWRSPPESYWGRLLNPRRRARRTAL
ncbi:glucans biosynthesis glucosyltransferase MdoH [Cellvibrio polysaccharolyticus]|nr:glucans biosynthesis glucosyltransferase MdoH [Cellvibrio polysaccharolyticus]